MTLGGGQQRKCVLMGSPGGSNPPGGGVAGAAPPLWGVAEDRRAGARGETSPLLSTLHIFFTDCLVDRLSVLPELII
jgi:hypothetical protein